MEQPREEILAVMGQQREVVAMSGRSWAAMEGPWAHLEALEEMEAMVPREPMMEGRSPDKLEGIDLAVIWLRRVFIPDCLP
jgi:hypothetical protein